MSTLRDKWIEHLEENNMTYCQHFKFAGYGALLIGINCVRLMIHALLPCFNRKALYDIHATVVWRRSMNAIIKLSNLSAVEQAFQTLDKEEEENKCEHTCHRKCHRRA